MKINDKDNTSEDESDSSEDLSFENFEGLSTANKDYNKTDIKLENFKDKYKLNYDLKSTRLFGSLNSKILGYIKY
jgi:hypothetical protein